MDLAMLTRWLLISLMAFSASIAIEKFSSIRKRDSVKDFTNGSAIIKVRPEKLKSKSKIVKSTTSTKLKVTSKDLNSDMNLLKKTFLASKSIFKKLTGKRSRLSKTSPLPHLSMTCIRKNMVIFPEKSLTTLQRFHKKMKKTRNSRNLNGLKSIRKLSLRRNKIQALLNFCECFLNKAFPVLNFYGRKLSNPKNRLNCNIRIEVKPRRSFSQNFLLKLAKEQLNMDKSNKDGSVNDSSDVNTTNTTIVPGSPTDRDTSLVTAPPSPNNDDKINDLCSANEYVPVSPSYSVTSPTYHTPGEGSEDLNDDLNDEDGKIPDSSDDEVGQNAGDRNEPIDEERIRVMLAHYRNKKPPTEFPQPVNPDTFRDPNAPILLDPILDEPAHVFKVPKDGFPPNPKARIILSSPGQVAKLRLPHQDQRVVLNLEDEGMLEQARKGNWLDTKKYIRKLIETAAEQNIHIDLDDIKDYIKLCPHVRLGFGPCLSCQLDMYSYYVRLLTLNRDVAGANSAARGLAHVVLLNCKLEGRIEDYISRIQELEELVRDFTDVRQAQGLNPFPDREVQKDKIPIGITGTKVDYPTKTKEQFWQELEAEYAEIELRHKRRFGQVDGNSDSPNRDFGSPAKQSKHAEEEGDVVEDDDNNREESTLNIEGHDSGAEDVDDADDADGDHDVARPIISPVTTPSAAVFDITVSKTTVPSSSIFTNTPTTSKPRMGCSNTPMPRLPIRPNPQRSRILTRRTSATVTSQNATSSPNLRQANRFGVVDGVMTMINHPARGFAPRPAYVDPTLVIRRDHTYQVNRNQGQVPLQDFQINPIGGASGNQPRQEIVPGVTDVPRIPRYDPMRRTLNIPDHVPREGHSDLRPRISVRFTAGGTEREISFGRRQITQPKSPVDEQQVAEQLRKRKAVPRRTPTPEDVRILLSNQYGNDLHRRMTETIRMDMFYSNAIANNYPVRTHWVSMTQEAFHRHYENFERSMISGHFRNLIPPRNPDGSHNMRRGFVSWVEFREEGTGRSMGYLLLWDHVFRQFHREGRVQFIFNKDINSFR